MNVSTLDGEVVKPAAAWASAGTARRTRSAPSSCWRARQERVRRVAIDKAQADSAGLGVGDPIRVSASRWPGQFTISGLVRFGNEDSTGAYYILFDLPTAQELFGMPGQLQQVSAQADEGVNQQELRDRVAEALPDYDVITGEQVGEEFSDSFGQIIDIFRNALLAFALVTLFVAGVLIGNVFTITLGQRVQELALLRAVGARWSQLMRSVVAEALLIGTHRLDRRRHRRTGRGVAHQCALASSGGGGLPTGSLVVTADLAGGAGGQRRADAVAVDRPSLAGWACRPSPRCARATRCPTARSAGASCAASWPWPSVPVALASGLFGSADTAPRLTLLVLGAILALLRRVDSTARGPSRRPGPRLAVPSALRGLGGDGPGQRRNRCAPPRPPR